VEPLLARQPGAGRLKVVAVVRDLFFVARIRETARLVGTPLVFARSPEEIAAQLTPEAPALVIIDLTTSGWDYDALFGALAAAPDVPVLGFTTHALARETQPLHARCRRVVTKETLTQELPGLLQHGLAA
jgi:DNA-binding NtrC family response regulator